MKAVVAAEATEEVIVNDMPLRFIQEAAPLPDAPVPVNRWLRDSVNACSPDRELMKMIDKFQ